MTAMKIEKIPRLDRFIGCWIKDDSVLEALESGGDRYGLIKVPGYVRVSFIPSDRFSIMGVTVCHF